MASLRRVLLRAQSGATAGLLAVGLVGYAAALLGALGWVAGATIELAGGGGS